MRPKEIFKKVKRERRSNLTEFESRKVLEYYKIPMAKAEIAKTAEEAVNVAEKIGFPVVLKIISPDIIHKTDVNGVFLDVKTKEEVRDAFHRIMSNVKRRAPKTRIKGIIVQEMIKDGREVIVGGKKDSQFGQVLMFGGGGVLTEVLEDVSFRVYPVNKKDVKDMIKETKCYKILKGYRGKSYDTKALIDILLKTSKLLEENQEIKELDINPVIALRKGAVAVDARIVLED